MTVKLLPEGTKEKIACLQLEGKWQWLEAEHILRYQMTMETSCPEVSPTDYLRLREVIKRFDKSASQEVVLSVSPEEPSKKTKKRKKRRRKKR
jgi:hypothetical protein